MHPQRKDSQAHQHEGQRVQAQRVEREPLGGPRAVGRRTLRERHIEHGRRSAPPRHSQAHVVARPAPGDDVEKRIRAGERLAVDGDNQVAAFEARPGCRAAGIDALDQKRLLPAIVLVGDAQQGFRGVVLRVVRPRRRIEQGRGAEQHRAEDPKPGQDTAGQSHGSLPVTT